MMARTKIRSQAASLVFFKVCTNIETIRNSVCQPYFFKQKMIEENIDRTAHGSDRFSHICDHNNKVERSARFLGRDTVEEDFSLSRSSSFINFNHRTDCEPMLVFRAAAASAKGAIDPVSSPTIPVSHLRMPCKLFLEFSPPLLPAATIGEGHRHPCRLHRRSSTPTETKVRPYR